MSYRKSRRLSYSVVSVLAVLVFFFGAGQIMCAPSKFAKGVTVNKAKKTLQGLTLYCVKGLGKAVLVDMAGNEVHTWTIPGLSAIMKPLDQGRLLVFANMAGNDAAIDSDVLREYDWDGNQVWEFRLPEGYKNFHHDFQRLPDGNVLLLSSRMSAIPAIPRQVEDNIILEVDRNKNIVRQWSTLDHYDQLALSEESRRIIADEIRETDVFHTNSIQPLPPNWREVADQRFNRGNLLVSQRRTGLVFIIDTPTGNIVWSSSVDTIGQHHASMIPRNMKGAGNIILFDNGGYSGYPTVHRFFSRIVEFNPLNGDNTWRYVGSDSNRRPIWTFFNMYRGGVQRLKNGNTLITESEWGRIFEVTGDGEIVWEYVSPYFREMPSNSNVGYTNVIYRAYRVNANWQTGVSGASYW